MDILLEATALRYRHHAHIQLFAALSAVKPRIFISHSAKGPEAQAVRDALKEALKSSGKYTVLLDVDTLLPGDRWRYEINLWLGSCDAAVVLLSKEALASAYVTYETSVLAYRNAVLDPSFLILPVLLEDVTPAALQASFLSPAQLTELQLVRGTPEEIVARVLARIEAVQPGALTPVEKRARKLADLLRDVPEEVLREAGEKAAFDLPWMSAGGDLRLRLAVQLMSVGMTAAIPVILTLRPHFPSAEKVARVQKAIELVASSWVDLRCVGRIPSIAKGKEPVRAFGINACRWDAAKMYLICASQDDPEGTWYIASCTGIWGEDTAELVHEVRASLREKLASPTDEDLRLDLESFDRSGQPVVVGLDRAGITDDVLATLRRELPHVTFFLLMGSAIEAGAPLSSAVVEMLFPRLIEGEETSFLQQYQTFERSLRVR